MTETTSHYDEAYFAWQRDLGAFGGWANLDKFAPWITPTSRVVDFGCGGGFLLGELRCGPKIGVEPNPAARAFATGRGIDVRHHASALADDWADVIISNSVLEHTMRPLDELRGLLPKLRPGGLAVFVVPCECITYRYVPNDVNHHLYSWSPMSIGNLFEEAGYRVTESKAYRHKWPPHFRAIARIGGRRVFNACARIYGSVDRTLYQVRVVARRPMA